MNENFVTFDKTVKVTPTVEWMKKTYDILNDWLFLGELGKCRFKVFTKGTGASGRRLGVFHVEGEIGYGIFIESKTRKIYVQHKRTFEKIRVNRKNFYSTCCPTISLNGNYKATEYAWASVLLHEMCHYYTNFEGKYPLQGHGIEFRSIANLVSRRSNNYFIIQRTERREVLQQMELDVTLQNKATKKFEDSVQSSICILVYLEDGTVRLVKTTMEKVKQQVLDYEKKKKKCTKIVEINDINFTYECLRHGYFSNCRTYRFWPVQDKPFAQNYEKYNHKLLFVA